MVSQCNVVVCLLTSMFTVILPVSRLSSLHVYGTLYSTYKLPDVMSLLTWLQCRPAWFQDVMLSGTSTQSPVSSVLTMPTVSMPTGSVASATIATSLTGALADSLFLGAVPSVPGSDLDPTKIDMSG